MTRSQLRSAGLTEAEIRQRLQSGALLREHRGVYRVGHRAPSLEARYLAAVYACGDGALLSGRAAAHLLGILPGPPPRPEITAPTERHVPGVTTRRHRSMHPLDAQFWSGVPVTSPARTIVDLAATLSAHELARVAHEEAIRHNTAPREIEAVLQRQPTAAGRRSSDASSPATSPSPSVPWSAASSRCCEKRASRSRSPTGPPAPDESTAAGPTTASRLSSTATATTAHATPGSRTAAASARRSPGATTSAATRTATSTSSAAHARRAQRRPT